MQIHYQFATSKKGNSSITEYFQTIKAMSNNLAVARQHLNDFESVSYLLVGLRLEYDPFVTSITIRLDPLSLNELYGHLLAHEMRIEHHLSSNEPTLPTAHFFCSGSYASFVERLATLLLGATNVMIQH